MTSRFLSWRGGETPGQDQGQQQHHQQHRIENYGHDRVRVPGRPAPRHRQPNPLGRVAIVDTAEAAAAAIAAAPTLGPVVVSPATPRHLAHSSLTVQPPRSPPSQLHAHQRQPPSTDSARSSIISNTTATTATTHRRSVSFSSNIACSPLHEDSETSSDNAPVPLLSSDPSDDDDNDMTMWCKKTSPTPNGRSKQIFSHVKSSSASSTNNSSSIVPSSNGTAPAERRASTQLGIVELPGSLLLDNEGFPSTDPAGNTRRARWGKGPEKVLPSLAASLGLEKPKPPEVNSMISHDAISIESTQSTSTSTERTTGSSTPQSPTRTNSNSRDSPRSRESPMRSDGPLRTPRNGQDYRMAQATTEAQRVGQILARRVKDLETSLKERDDSIARMTAEFEMARKAHALEMSKIKELHSTEILSLKTTFTLLETGQGQGFIRQGPLQISTIDNTGRSERRQLENHSSDNSDLLRSWGSDLEQALRSTSASGGSAPSTNLSGQQQKSEERIREELSAEFEKRLEGERRRRKEVLERAQDLHQARESELQEKLKSRDQRVTELENEVAIFKSDIDMVEKRLEKFIGYYKQSENENVTYNRERKRLEIENDALKKAIQTHATSISNLTAEISELRLNSNRSGSDDNYQSGNTVAPSVTSTDPMTRIKELEDLVAFHVDDIRLYKLDCKGYKKDIKSRDAKIARLAQHVAELEKKLFITTTEHEDLQQLLREAGRTDFEDVLVRNQRRYEEAYQRHSAKVLDDLARARKGGLGTPPSPAPAQYWQAIVPPNQASSAAAAAAGAAQPNPASFAARARSPSNTTRSATASSTSSTPSKPPTSTSTAPTTATSHSPPPNNTTTTYAKYLTADSPPTTFPSFNPSSSQQQPPQQPRPLQVPRAQTPNNNTNNAPVSAVGLGLKSLGGAEWGSGPPQTPSPPAQPRSPTPTPPAKDPRRVAGSGKGLDKPLPLPFGGQRGGNSF